MKDKTIKISILPVITCLIFHAIIIRIYYINNYTTISTICLAIICIYMLPKINILMLKKFFRVNVTIFILFVIFMISALINSWNYDGTLQYMLKIILLFWFFEYVNEKGKTDNVIKVLMLLGLSYSLYNLYLVLQNPLIAWKHNMVYLLGTKFSMSYLILMTLVLFTYLYDEKIKIKKMYKLMFVGLAFLAIFISIKLNCSTGMIASIMFIIFYLNPFSGIKNFMRKPKNAIIIFVISCLILVLFYEVILNISIIQRFIEEILNRSITLTGRVFIYNKSFSFLHGHILFGHGYNSVCYLFKNTMRIGNNAYALDAQNALLEYWFYGGILAVITILILIYNCFKSNYISKNKNDVIIFGIYVFLILGMVEITINFYLFLFLAILSVNRTRSNYREEQNEKENGMYIINAKS